MKGLWVGASVDPLLPESAKAVLFSEQQRGTPEEEAFALAAVSSHEAAEAQPRKLANAAVDAANALSEFSATFQIGGSHPSVSLFVSPLLAKPSEWPRCAVLQITR